MKPLYKRNKIVGSCWDFSLGNLQQTELSLFDHDKNCLFSPRKYVEDFRFEWRISNQIIANKTFDFNFTFFIETTRNNREKRF